MMKKGFLAVAAIALAIAGCGSGHSFDGKWSATTEGLPDGSTLTATFAGSNKMTMAMDIPQPLPGGKSIQLHGDVNGTYQVDGEYMTVHADDVKFSGSGFPAELKPMLESSLGQMNDSVKQKLNEAGKAKVTWVSNDSFTLTGKSGKPETFTRVK